MRFLDVGAEGRQCTLGLNFDTKRPRREILQDYRDVLEKIYDPHAYAGRVQSVDRLLNNASRAHQMKGSDSKRHSGSMDIMQRLVAKLPEPKRIFWEPSPIASPPIPNRCAISR